MNSTPIRIFKDKKSVGIYIGEFIVKISPYERYISVKSDCPVAIGDVIATEEIKNLPSPVPFRPETFYVTDVILDRISKDNMLRVYYETEGEHKAKLSSIRHNWKLQIFSTIAGAVAGLATSIIFWFITK